MPLESEVVHSISQFGSRRPLWSVARRYSAATRPRSCSEFSARRTVNMICSRAATGEHARPLESLHSETRPCGQGNSTLQTWSVDCAPRRVRIATIRRCRSLSPLLIRRESTTIHLSFQAGAWFSVGETGAVALAQLSFHAREAVAVLALWVVEQNRFCNADPPYRTSLLVQEADQACPTRKQHALGG